MTCSALWFVGSVWWLVATQLPVRGNHSHHVRRSSRRGLAAERSDDLAGASAGQQQIRKHLVSTNGTNAPSPTLPTLLAAANATQRCSTRPPEAVAQVRILPGGTEFVLAVYEDCSSAFRVQQTCNKARPTLPPMPRRTKPPCPIDPEPPRWVLLPEAAAYAGVTTRTMRSWASNGTVPVYRIGPKLLQIDLNDIDALRVRVPTRAGGMTPRHAAGPQPKAGGTANIAGGDSSNPTSASPAPVARCKACGARDPQAFELRHGGVMKAPASRCTKLVLPGPLCL
jgi:hypothetical protein